MAERVADYLVGQHSRMPRLSRPEQPIAATGSLVHALHRPRMPSRRKPRLTQTSAHAAGRVGARGEAEPVAAATA